MKWERVSQLVALGSNLAVLAGIVLVAFELRQNTAAMQAQMSQSRVDNISEGYREMMHSDYWPGIQAKRDTASGPAEWVASLTPEERHRVRYYVLAEVNDIANQFYQFRQGNLDPDIWNGATRGQVERVLPLIPAVIPDLIVRNPETKAELNRIARENGLPTIP